MPLKRFLSGPYAFQGLLLVSLVGGGLSGGYFPEVVPYLKPLADIFLNLLLSAIVPLVFFSVASATARAAGSGSLSRILCQAALVFLITGTLAALWSLIAVMMFPPAKGVSLTLPVAVNHVHPDISTHIASLFTVPDFGQLFSHQHMLALMVFSLLTGLACAKSSPDNPFLRFLTGGEQVFLRMFSLIMWLAPIGFFAWFALLISTLGPKFAGVYLQIGLVCYTVCLLWFAGFYSLCAFIAGGRSTLARFWKFIPLPALTALATCSSAASLPANLLASQSMGVPPVVAETVIPLGTMLHKQGSIIGAMFKIAFLFGVFQLDFSGATVVLTAIGVSFLTGSVMGAIPGGGMLGELFILTVYGFPPESLIAVAAISLLIDPVATLLNVTGNTASTLLIARRSANKT
ncbi:dicarboxylate/amino acid:cation symporter [Legionella geestiana]|uniref:dicarboxylate/amino acid:cation symporter n=1 Tax=Legionella geestiana TaxID=45065 RepID=UPI001FE4D900|nr:dicarboxylate/amino acid:cation symporter [Legionella geestiana]